MNVCILGGGLSSLTLAKTLVNQGISVDVCFKQKNLKHSSSRTIGISKSNIDFFNKNIVNIEKILWNINKIEIFTENLKNKKILNFEDNKDQLFSVISNNDLYNFLYLVLKKDNLFKETIFKNKNFLLKNDYDLIINCDPSHQITKKFFFKTIKKDYKSFAYTTIINHKRIENKVAVQIFTKKGPIAFLPISNYETSIVYSIHLNDSEEKVNMENLIKKYNSKYSIVNIRKIEKFNLESFNLRSYYYKNILAFGDLLHRPHPLAGQGFNMTIRDIQTLSKLIENKMNLGLQLDKSICIDFEKKTKHKNYIFSNGIDFIHEFFNFERKMNNKILSKSIGMLNKNKSLKLFLMKFADNGLVI